MGDVGPRSRRMDGRAFSYSPAVKNQSVVRKSTRHRTSEHATSATRLSRNRTGPPNGAATERAIERRSDARARGLKRRAARAGRLAPLRATSRAAKMDDGGTAKSESTNTTSASG